MHAEFALNQMVRQQVRTWDVLDQKVLNVMTEVPRGRFTPLAYLGVAYADHEIPLENGRKMLRPSLVGRVLQALDVKPGDSVLHLGTSSGYVAACLASLAGSVISIDTDAEFIEKSQQVCDDLGISNIQFRHQPDFAVSGESKFDVVLITGSLSTYDASYEKLLKTGGRLFVAVGDAPAMDALLVRKMNEDSFFTESLFETDLARLQQESGSEFSF